MDSFINDSLQHLNLIFSLLPHDPVLYGKCESFLNSALAAIGNINLHYNGIQNYYYRTEYKNTIDLVRLDSQTKDILFMLESKFLYMSDFGIKCNKKDMLNKIAFPSNIKHPNHVEYVLSKAIYQLQNYQQIYNCINTDLTILVSFLYFPYGTNGYHERNSGIKYINRDRLYYDIGLFRKCHYNMDVLIDYVSENLIEKSLVITHPYNCVNLKIKYKQYFKLVSMLGFYFFIVCIAFTI